MRWWLILAAAVCSAQELDVQLMSHERMMSSMGSHMHMDEGAEQNTADLFLMNLMSGTSVNPAGWQMPMIMQSAGSWQTMFMGQAFLNETQQSGPRGGDKFFAPNWFMGMAEHSLGSRAGFQFQLMLSLDPATVTNRRYPLLFQTGESAYGKPIVDGQHPHDLFMGISFQYARQLSKNTIVTAMYAPVGDPALGPVAFPHRASASELPQATLSHHWQDATHIADNVATVGLAYRKFKLEASGFYGQEPNENRWNIDWGGMDSWSARLWYFPTPNWAAQFSTGRVTHPEELQAGDVERTTASIEYTRAMRGASWATSLIWGRNHYTDRPHNGNSYTLETVIPVSKRNLLTGRAELVDKDELVNDGRNYRIGAYTVGYTHDFALFRYVQTGIGANVEFYTLPDAIKPNYGNHPAGGNVFVRLRLKSPE